MMPKTWVLGIYTPTELLLRFCYKHTHTSKWVIFIHSFFFSNWIGFLAEACDHDQRPHLHNCSNLYLVVGKWLVFFSELLSTSRIFIGGSSFYMQYFNPFSFLLSLVTESRNGKKNVHQLLLPTTSISGQTKKIWLKAFNKTRRPDRVKVEHSILNIKVVISST